MKILFQTRRDRAIRIDIGFDTPFQSCLYWFTITREYYDSSGEVEDASWIWAFWKDSHPKTRLRKFQWEE
jgi:hypothetical protein